MKVKFELTDSEQEPLISLDGHDYIPPIGSDIVFYDTFEDKDGDISSIEFVAKVESYQYMIHENTTYVYCVLFDEINEHDITNISNYNNAKYASNKKNKR